jgi:malonyl CoA-acyl carrier protein transacylase
MGREVALYFKEMREALELADRQLRHRFPKLLSQFIYPPSAYSEAAEEYNQQQLTDTHIAQPAIGTVEAGYLDLLTRLGLQADMVAGHSYGEYAALHAAGVLSRETFFKLSETRGRVMSAACAAADGAMAAVRITREELLARLEGFGKVVIANHNAPLQSVISGEKKAVREVVDALNVAQIMARMLPVAGAFHSSLVESAQASLSGAIASAPMQSPKIPVYGNSTARPYDSDINAIRNQLSRHLLSPVEFVSQIKTMYDDGARIFVEVGPKSILSKLVGQILNGTEHTVVSLDAQGGGLRGLLLALGTLAVRGININLTALFEGRDVQALELSRLVELTRKPQLPPTTWLVNGGGVRHISEEISYTGKLPPLTLETATQAKAVKVEHREKEEKPLVLGQAQEQRPDSPAMAQTNQAPPKHSPVPPLPSSKFAQQPTTPLQMSTPTPNHGASQPQVPSVSQTNHQPPVSADAAVVAYQAYQQTMRQFLTLQEQVMQQFLSGSQTSQIVPPTPAATPPAQIPAAQPNLSNGNYNGNGARKHPSVAMAHSAPVPTPNALTPPEPVPPPRVIVEPTVEPVLPCAPPTPAKSAIPERSELMQTLLRLVSDRTGYPIEMLGLDQDLEAELGIDSIKRVEILGALQKTLPSPLAASIQERMESLTRVKSLYSMVEQILSSLPTVAPTATPTVQTPTSVGVQSLTPLPDKITLTQTLLNLVSDRTGYPTDMLGLDQDLEAELGIDSIKRVEILGALQKSLPEPLAATMQSDMDSLTRVKSLNGIVEKLLATIALVPGVEEKDGLGKHLSGGKASHAM